MKKVLILISVSMIGFLFIFITSSRIIYADELESINSKLADLHNALQSSEKATATNEKNLASLTSRLTAIKNQVDKIETDIVKKEADIKDGEERLAKQKKLLDERVASYYKNKGRATDALLQIILSDNLTMLFKQFAYQQSLLDGDRKSIVRIVLLVKDVEEKKLALEDERTRLIPIKEEIAKQSSFLEGEVLSAKKFQQGLKTQIASLTAKQQQIINQRQSGLNLPRSAGSSVGRCVDDRTVDPGFAPRIAFFTYGAPHRKGLNQYGAWGRAKDGQNEEQILSEYYPGMSLRKDYDTNATITTTTGWSGTVEDYVKRIYEVPDSWTDNNLAVLKAQAVAARTYALNSMQRNGSICTTESCQVFKPDPKGGNWEQAVNATAGWVLMDGGNPGFTQYASTHGGYILNLNKFDGKGGAPNSFSELNERAYDRESPWFYCDWGSRSEYNKTAWLKPSELADIANVILLARADSSTSEKLYQQDKPHPYGGEIWNTDRVKQELKSKGISPFDNISDVSISADFGSGKTTGVTVSGDGKSQSFGGDEFKGWFNLRAPANIQIVGPLFNVERQ